MLALKLLAARLLEKRACPFPCPPADLVWQHLDQAPAMPTHPATHAPGAPCPDPAQQRLARHWQRRRGR